MIIKRKNKEIKIEEKLSLNNFNYEDFIKLYEQNHKVIGFNTKNQYFLINRIVSVDLMSKEFGETHKIMEGYFSGMRSFKGRLKIISKTREYEFTEQKNYLGGLVPKNKNQEKELRREIGKIKHIEKNLTVDFYLFLFGDSIDEVLKLDEEFRRSFKNSIDIKSIDDKQDFLYTIREINKL